MTTEEIESALQEQADVLNEELPDAHLVLIAYQEGRLHLCHNLTSGDAAVVTTLRVLADQLESELGKPS